jgi:hypothetical protein
MLGPWLDAGINRIEYIIIPRDNHIEFIKGISEKKIKGISQVVSTEVFYLLLIRWRVGSRYPIDLIQ